MAGTKRAARDLAKERVNAALKHLRKVRDASKDLSEQERRDILGSGSTNSHRRRGARAAGSVRDARSRRARSAAETPGRGLAQGDVSAVRW